MVLSPSRIGNIAGVTKLDDLLVPQQGLQVGYNNDRIKPPKTLSIPDIVAVIVAFLPRQDLVNCLRVSTVFYAAIIPIICRKTSVNIPLNSKFDETPTPSCPSFLRYKHYVHEIDFNRVYKAEYLQGNFQNLHTISLSYRYNDYFYFLSMVPFIEAHSSTLQNIFINQTFHSMVIPPDSFYQAIASCTNLKSLALSNIQIKNEQLADFVKVCSLLQTLYIHYVYFSYNPKKILGIVFPNIHTLTLNNGFCNQFGAAEFTLCCPNLKVLSLRMSEFIGSQQVQLTRHDHKCNCNDYIKILSQDSPFHSSLESLDISWTSCNDQVYGNLFSKLSQLKSINPSNSDIGNEWFLSLGTLHNNGRLCDTIVNLNIEDCQNIKSWMIQQILETFSALESFQASTIEVSDIIQGKGWICGDLKRLSITIGQNIKPSKYLVVYKSAHSTIYSRLASLSKLEELSLQKVPGTKSNKVFKLKSDLQSKLHSSLKNLKSVVVASTPENESLVSSLLSWFL